MRVILAVAMIVLALPANAETPQLRCFTSDETTISTLPHHAEKMWHQAAVRGTTPDQAAAIWFQFPAGTAVGVYVSYMIDGVEWDWISGQTSEGAIVSGWAERSQLKCE